MMIIGITARADVADLLEKRLRSRFSNRQVLFPPVSPDQYEEVCRLLSHMLSSSL